MDNWGKENSKVMGGSERERERDVHIKYDCIKGRYM